MHDRACHSVGIDLGTTFSSLAYMDAQLTPRIIADSSGSVAVPSVIFFDDEEIIIGELAVQQATIHADRVAQFIKVHMGDVWSATFRGHEYTPESLSAILLSHLVREAELQIGPIRSAVITVPAFFTEKRRQATQQAGQIANLDVIGTLNEPMAATLAYGLHRHNEEQIVVVYDLGGGTFDVTVVKLSPSEIQELATCGNRQLGGRDWDRCLIDFVADDFRAAHGFDPRTDVQAHQDLQLGCEAAKRRLSRMSGASIKLIADGQVHVTTVTRPQFEDITTSLLNTTKLTTELALAEADLTWDQVSRVLLVGGSTQMPAVREMLRRISGKAPATEVNPVTAVALGAAVYAYMLEKGDAPVTIAGQLKQAAEEPILSVGDAGEIPRGASDADDAAPVHPKLLTALSTAETIHGSGREDTAESASVEPLRSGFQGEQSIGLEFPEVRFVTAHGVGVKVLTKDGWKNSILIRRNTRVPCSTTKRFLTSSETGGGTYVRVEITQGDTTDAGFTETLGVGRIEGFPAREPPGQPVDVLMEFDDEGRLHISAEYKNTGQKMEMSLEMAGVLRAEEVEEHREHLLTLFDPQKVIDKLSEEDELNFADEDYES